jgi:hypothetical protein
MADTITSVQYTTADGDYVRVSFADGDETFFPWPVSGWRSGEIDTFLGGSSPDAYASPPAIIPTSISRRQFKMQLEIDGLTASVDTWVASQSALTQIAYNEAGSFSRDDTMLQGGFSALGFDDATVDAFFLAASQL